MKNVLIRGLFLVLGLWSTLQTLAAQDLGKWSKSDGLVVVRTANNPLSAEEEQALEILLQTRLDSTGARLVVVLTDGIQDDINLYAVELGQRWGIGSADEDNGALLLVDLENRQMALQVGYGLEDELPDITCSHIIQNRRPACGRRSRFCSHTRPVPGARTRRKTKPPGFCAAFGGGGLDAVGVPQPKQSGPHLRVRRPFRRWAVLFSHGRRFWRRLRWRRFWWWRRRRFWRRWFWRRRIQRQLVTLLNPGLLAHLVRVEPKLCAFRRFLKVECTRLANNPDLCGNFAKDG
jgi:hypothetical protein